MRGKFRGVLLTTAGHTRFRSRHAVGLHVVGLKLAAVLVMVLVAGCRDDPTPPKELKRTKASELFVRVGGKPLSIERQFAIGREAGRTIEIVLSSSATADCSRAADVTGMAPDEQRLWFRLVRSSATHGYSVESAGFEHGPVRGLGDRRRAVVEGATVSGLDPVHGRGQTFRGDIRIRMLQGEEGTLGGATPTTITVDGPILAAGCGELP